MPYSMGSKGYGGGSGSGSYPSIPSPYLPGFSSMLLGRHDFSSGRNPVYGGGGGLGLLGLGFGISSSSYGSPYGAGSSYSGHGGYGSYTSTAGQKSYYTPMPTITEHSSANSSARKGGRIPRTYIPVVPYPSAVGNRPALYSSSGVKTLFTEDIDVTTPRKTAKPGEISRERSNENYGTIRRGRTVIRLETKKLKENPYLSEVDQQKKEEEKQKEKEREIVSTAVAAAVVSAISVENELDENPPKETEEKVSQPVTKDYSHVAKWYEEEIRKPMKKERNAGDKFREKYMVHSQKNKHAGYRRPTLSDIRAQKAVVLKEIEERVKKLANSAQNPEVDERLPEGELKTEEEKLEKDKEKLARLDKKMAKRFSRALKKADPAINAGSSDDESISVDRQATVKGLRRSSTGTIKAADLSKFTTDQPFATVQGQRLTRKVTKRFFFPQEAGSVVQPEIVEAHHEPADPTDLYEKNILAQRQTTKMRNMQKKFSHINQRKSSASDLEIPFDLLSDKLCDVEVKEILEPTDELLEELLEEVKPKLPTVKEATPGGKKKKYVKKVGDPPAKRVPGNILQPLIPPEGLDSPPSPEPEPQIAPKKIAGKVNGLIAAHQACKQPIVKNNYAKPTPKKIQESVLTNVQAAVVGGLPVKKTENEPILKFRRSVKEIMSTIEAKKDSRRVSLKNLPEGNATSNNITLAETKKLEEAIQKPVSTIPPTKETSTSAFVKVKTKSIKKPEAEKAKEIIEPKPESVVKASEIKPAEEIKIKPAEEIKIKIEPPTNSKNITSTPDDGKQKGTKPANNTTGKMKEEANNKSPLIAKLKPKLALDNKSASFDAITPRLKMENKSASLDSKEENKELGKREEEKPDSNPALVQKKGDNKAEEKVGFLKKTPFQKGLEQNKGQDSKGLPTTNAFLPSMKPGNAEKIIPRKQQNEIKQQDIAEKKEDIKTVSVSGKDVVSVASESRNKVPEANQQVKPSVSEEAIVASKNNISPTTKKEIVSAVELTKREENLSPVKRQEKVATKTAEEETPKQSESISAAKSSKGVDVPKKISAVVESPFPSKQNLVPVKVQERDELFSFEAKNKQASKTEAEVPKLTSKTGINNLKKIELGSKLDYSAITVTAEKKTDEIKTTTEGKTDAPKIQGKLATAQKDAGPESETKKAETITDTVKPLQIKQDKTDIKSLQSSNQTNGEVKGPMVDKKTSELKDKQANAEMKKPMLEKTPEPKEKQAFKSPPQSPKSPLSKVKPDEKLTSEKEEQGKTDQEKEEKVKTIQEKEGKGKTVQENKAASEDSGKSGTVKENKQAQNMVVPAPAAKDSPGTTASLPPPLQNGHLSPPLTPKGKTAMVIPPPQQPVSADKQQSSKSPQPSATTQKEGAITTPKVGKLGCGTELTTNGPEKKTRADGEDLLDISAQMNKLGNLSLASENISKGATPSSTGLKGSSEQKSNLPEVIITDNNARNNKLEKSLEPKGGLVGGDGATDTLPNPVLESLIRKKRGTSESSESSSISSSGSSVCTAKSESGSSSSSTLSAGSSVGSRRMPSPPIDDDSDDERISRDKICPAKNRPKYRKYEIEDFQFLKVLGKGSFGKVLLAELKGADSYFAIKCLKKDVVLEDDDVECTMIERKVLLMGSKHPYLCHLFCTFQTESHLFFVMEYLNGGDLMFHIQQSGKFTEERARFYGAEIVSGLKFLHKRGVIYRDLKLDNILLDYEGHIRIADFGMCKLQIYLDRTADTFCGTPDYMAPEIIKGLRYNQCVDWWAFGVLMYEMLVGQSPFSGHDEDELFWSVCNEPVHYPRFLGKESKRLLELLLEKDASKRLGTVGCIQGDVKEQQFFQPIDWERLEKRDLEPPFKPKLKHSLDVQYFDTTFTKEVARLTPVDKEILRSMDQTQFEGFSYTNPHTTD